MPKLVVKSIIGYIIIVIVALAIMLVGFPFLLRWVWSVAIPGCFPGLVDKGTLARTISWKIAFCLMLLPAIGLAWTTISSSD